MSRIARICEAKLAENLGRRGDDGCQRQAQQSCAHCQAKLCDLHAEFCLTHHAFFCAGCFELHNQNHTETLPAGALAGLVARVRQGVKFMATDCPSMRRQHCLVALSEYLELREALAALEARECECQCDLDNFHTCALCFEVRAKRQRSQSLMQSWGDSWAVLLRSAMTKLEELHQFLDDLGDGAPDASPSQKKALHQAAEIRREYLAQAETVIQSLQGAPR